MGQWKSGDTCQIKPYGKNEEHDIEPDNCGMLWTVDVVDGDEVTVHNGSPGVAPLEAAVGYSSWAVVPLTHILPAGNARPFVAAKAGAEVLRLRARVAELEATVTNERGQGAPPVEGWEWEPDDEAWAIFKDGGGFYVTRTLKGWTWDGDRVSSGQPHFDTARDAMRAAPVVPDAQR